MFCSYCGQVVKEGSRFCAVCGTAVQGGQASLNPAAVTPTFAPPQVTQVIVVEPKRAGAYAIKAFLIALVLVVVVDVALKDSPAAVKGVWNAIIFGTATLVTFVNLNHWKKSRSPVKGSGIAWCVMIFMALICFGGFMSVVTPSSTSSSSLSSSGEASPTEDPKTVALRDVKLDFKWNTSGFGSIMMADFTLTNPTIYRLKDFEISCTHYAESGTRIDSNTKTIYEIVEPHSTRKVKQMNMGFIHSQAASSACKVTDLVVIQ